MMDEQPKSTVQEDIERLFLLPEGQRVLSCIQCGTCAGTCPHGEYMDYTPRKIIAMLRAGQVDEVINSKSMLKCLSCYACQLKCPRGIKLTDVLLPIIKGKVFESIVEMPPELQRSFENTLRYGNPMGESPKKRAEWTKNSKVPVRILKENPAPVDVLWIVECYPSYHPRGIDVTLATARTFHRLGIDFAILGEEERCIGDCAGYFGEFGLQEALIDYSLNIFRKYKFNRIVTSGSHAFNTFQRWYPRYDFNIPVHHAMPFIATYIDRLKPFLKKPLNYTVTYHDPCCLGRCVGVSLPECFYHQPRILLSSIPGIKVVEMVHHRENSICCGGGGGGMWLDTYFKAEGMERLSERVVKEAVAAGADVLAVSCDYEISRFEDAVKVLGLEEKIKVRDIMELIDESAGGDETL